MILDKFNMVDMGGIDVVYSQNIAVAGLYQRLVESIALCRYSTLYSWKFAGINIPPTPVELVHENSVITINEAISVDSNDVVHIQSLEPILEALSVSENGLYLPPEGHSGFSQVDVEIPLGTKEITENATYSAEDDLLAGYSSVTVTVTGTTFTPLFTFNQSQGGAWINSGIDMTELDGVAFLFLYSGAKHYYAEIIKADIAVYTGGADVYTSIHSQNGKIMNIRIYNSLLYVSYSNTGSSDYSCQVGLPFVVIR